MNKLRYSKRTDGKFTIETITINLPSLEWLLTEENHQEIISKQIKGPKNRFWLDISCPSDKDDIFEIYYISPKTVHLKCVLTIHIGNFTDGPIKIEKDYHTLQSNKWQYLGTVVKKMFYIYNSGSVECEFIYNITEEPDYFKVQDGLLSNDFETLLNNGMFSDVIMKSTEGNEYTVHKAVLASRSAVLKAHFEHNTTECFTNTIETPLEADVLREVLTFIYSDKAPRVNEIPEKLLVAADYYQLNRLKSLCEKALHKRLTVENAIKTLQLADLHSLNTLKELTLEFIKSNWGLIIKSEGWSELQSHELIKSICEYVTLDLAAAHIKRVVK